MNKSNGKKRKILRNILISIAIVIAVLVIVLFFRLKNTVLINFPELKGSPVAGEWYAITPEEAKSSDGSEWNGFIRLGSENKVMVYFFGGGVSINEYTAAHSKSFYADVVKNQDFVAKMGISSDTEENPFKDWTILVLPYSTGDFHSGTGEFAYTDDKGKTKTLYHYGYTNFSLFMKEAVKYTGTPDTLLVTGFSAGGFGASLLADEVIDYYPSTSNITVAVDSSLLLTDDWHDIAGDVWGSPVEISERLTKDNIVLDSLTALYDKRGDSVKILFDSSVRDGELAKWQAYLDYGKMSATDESGDVYQSNLKAMVEGLQNNIPGVGIYIWDGLPYDKEKNLTQHTIISSNVFDKLNGEKSISDWIIDAVNGDVKQYGIELLEKDGEPISSQPLLEENYSDVYKTESVLEQKYINMGSYDVSTIEFSSKNNESIQSNVWYPTELANTNHAYPLIVIVNASDTNATRYEPFFKHLASWGFVVVGNEDRMSSSGEFSAESLDLMLKLNSDADHLFYGKIDIDNIGIAGFSQGGVGAINAVTAQKNGHYYKTIFTGSAANIDLSKALGWNYDVSKITIPYFMTAGTLKNDTGEDNGIGVAPLSSLIQNYDMITDEVLKIRARAVNADHDDMLVRSDGYLTAWMMYHLQGDEEAGKAFLGDTAEILNNISWQDVQISQ